MICAFGEAVDARTATKAISDPTIYVVRSPNFKNNQAAKGSKMNHIPMFSEPIKEIKEGLSLKYSSKDGIKI